MSGGAAIALCASSATFSVAARAASGAVQSAQCDGQRQSALATALLDEVLARAGTAREDIVEIRVDRGPGSYTGLRMALAFARVLATFTGAELRAATSLELLALAAWRRLAVPTARAVRPLLDARRGRIHTARVEWTPTGIVLATAPCAVPAAEAAAMRRADETVLLAPSLGAAESGVLTLPAISAADLFDPWLRAQPVAPEGLEPLYLMGTYAE